MALTFQGLRDSIEQGGLLSRAPRATPTDLRYAVQQLAQTDPQYAGLLQQSLGSTYNGMQGLSSALWNGLQGAGQENTNYGSPEEATAAAKALLAGKSGELGGLLQQGIGTYQSQFAGPQDDDFFGMKMEHVVPLTLAVMGGGFASGLGLTGAGAGAFTGGFSGGLNTYGNGGSLSDSLKNAAKGAAGGGAVGGATSYAGDYLSGNGYSGIDYGDGSAFPAGDGSAWTPSSIPPQSPMEVPSYEWQNPQIPEIQAPTQTLDPSGTIPPAWNTPLLNPNVQPSGPVDYGDGSAFPSAPNAPSVPQIPPMEVPSTEWQNPKPLLEPQTLDPSGSDALKKLPADIAKPGLTGNKFIDGLLSNPKLWAAGAGALTGLLDNNAGGSGGYSYSGPMPTITRGGWSPTATPTYAQPAARPLLNTQPGQANSGLWRFMGSGQ